MRLPEAAGRSSNWSAGSRFTRPALVTAGVDAGYLVNSRLAKVHWQPGDRALRAPVVAVAGESGQWVDPAEIPSEGDVAKPMTKGLPGQGFQISGRASTRPPRVRSPAVGGWPATVWATPP